MSRGCPICGSTHKTYVYEQKFTQLSSGTLFAGYQVVTCAGCGCGYADDIPEQSVFDEYYATMSKYESNHAGGQASSSAKAMFKDIAESISPFITKDATILDIGCATGALLNEFKTTGFPNVVGIDPSAACVKTAQELYCITAHQGTLSNITEIGEFDLVSMNAVLEHVRDLYPALEQVKKLVKLGGLLWVEVPNVTSFSYCVSAPYQQFSVEHINYFSSRSLANLLGQFSFKPVKTWRVARKIEGVTEPSLGILFRLESEPMIMVRDVETRPALVEYIRVSRDVEEEVAGRIDEVVARGEEIVVWGVGTHTQHLLATSSLSKANIIAFVDRNARYQDKTLRGIPIVAPEAVKMLGRAVMVSSRTYQEEIAEQIKELGPNVEIIRLYNIQQPNR